MDTEHQRVVWFGPDVSPDDAARAFALYERFVGITPGPSPASTGRRLMDLLRPRGQTRDAVTDWPPCALQPSTVTDLTFVRDLTPAERGRRYLHAYDKNGMYLAACSSVELGLGDLEHWDWEVPFGAHLPGYWRFAGRAEWLPTPLARRLVETGELPELAAEAYIWRRHGRALVHWYERLRDARTALAVDDTRAGRLALGAVKESYTMAIGWLTGYWFNPDDPRYRPESGGHASPHFRPDWRHMIIAAARANMLRTIAAIGSAVVACHIDALYIVSDEPRARVAAPSCLNFAASLGAWKVRYEAIPLPAVLEHLNARSRAVRLDRACQEAEDGD